MATFYSTTLYYAFVRILKFCWIFSKITLKRMNLIACLMFIIPGMFTSLLPPGLLLWLRHKMPDPTDQCVVWPPRVSDVELPAQLGRGEHGPSGPCGAPLVSTTEIKKSRLCCLLSIIHLVQSTYREYKYYLSFYWFAIKKLWKLCHNHWRHTFSYTGRPAKWCHVL